MLKGGIGGMKWGKNYQGDWIEGENVFDWGWGDNLLKRDEGSWMASWRSDVSRRG
jgi:hypothetical protein